MFEKRADDNLLLKIDLRSASHNSSNITCGVVDFRCAAQVSSPPRRSSSAFQNVFDTDTDYYVIVYSNHSQ